MGFSISIYKSIIRYRVSLSTYRGSIVETTKETYSQSNCQHQSFEDCMNCVVCGKCSEQLNDDEVCPSCIRYRIVRFYQDTTHPDHHKEIDSGLTRTEAIDYCSLEESQEVGVFFDGFEAE